MRHHFHHYVQYELLLENYCMSLLSLLAVDLLKKKKKYLAE